MMNLIGIAVLLIVAGAALMLIAIAIFVAAPKRTQIRKGQSQPSQKQMGCEDEGVLVV